MVQRAARNAEYFRKRRTVCRDRAIEQHFGQDQERQRIEHRDQYAPCAIVPQKIVHCERATIDAPVFGHHFQFVRTAVGRQTYGVQSVHSACLVGSEHEVAAVDAACEFDAARTNTAIAIPKQVLFAVFDVHVSTCASIMRCSPDPSAHQWVPNEASDRYSLTVEQRYQIAELRSAFRATTKTTQTRILEAVPCC